MINKTNWQLVKKYLDFRLHVDQISTGSLKREQTHTRHLLLWADNHSFRNAQNIRPSFPEYLLSARLDGKEKSLSAVYVKKALATARWFFSWLSDNEEGYRSIKQVWIRTLKIKRLSDAPKVKDVVSLEEIIAIARCPVRTVVERRARAACVMLYLSGMRIGAFISLPVQAVDIAKRTVIQYPSLGVRTKNNKFAVTYLLDIPELLGVVNAWDKEVREADCKYWFALLDFWSGEFDLKNQVIGEHRTTLARRNIKTWLESNGFVYRSPHRFRHGHVHYGSALASTMADYKAVSQNVMHSSIEITDAIYSVLNDADVQKRISSLGKQKRPDDENQDVLELLRQFLEWKNQN